MPTQEKSRTDFHAISPEKTLKSLNSDIIGLGNKTAEERLEKYGPNELPEKKGTHPALIFAKQFHSILIYILFFAAAISYYLEQMIDVYVILGVVLINATMGFIQEYRAEKSIRALKKMIVPQAKVFRSGELLRIHARELVPGDIILLEEGDKVPADARLVENKNLRTVESSLTGEALPVDKDIRPISAKAVLADMKNMVWMGTFVASGQAKAVVTATGQKTEIGKIAKDIQKIKTEKSHFEKKTDLLAKQMGVFAAIGAAVIFIVGYLINGIAFEEIFLFAIASLISAIPEGLPAVLVIVLAVGSRRMAKRNAIIRTLPATETLGVVDTIITDKTGTLTENTMNAEKILLPSGEEVSISGKGWEPKGEFVLNEKEIIPLENRQLEQLLNICALCNSSRLIKKEGENRYDVIGDPTEASLMVVAEKAGIRTEVLQESEMKLYDLPFNPENRFRATLVNNADNGSLEVYAIGAPEVLISKASHVLHEGKSKKLTKKERENLEAQIDSLTKKAMRVLAVAYKPHHKKAETLSEEDVEKLTILGIVGLRDPIKSSVPESIEKAKRAGVRVIMATGDHKETALAIAKEIGLINHDKSHPPALTEKELVEMNKKEFKDAIKSTCVFARLTPSMKLKIAEALQEEGHVVAMTGDGINDAPALKKADIGISMGIIGTDVARESSEIVLADDNFSSIINAIEEGRIVFRNTQQASSFLITTNVAEQLTILSTLFLGLPLPLSAIQILWLNLVTDGVSDIAIAAEPGHGDILEEPPKRAGIGILSREFIPFLLLMAAIMVVSTLAVYHALLPFGTDMARTGAFVVMAFTQLFNVLNMRSLRRSVFEIGLFSNKYVCASILASLALLGLAIYSPTFQGTFGFCALALKDLIGIVVLSSFVFWFGEVYKRIQRRRPEKPNNNSVDKL